MSERRFGLLAAIPLSFFSKDLYRDVARAWPGMGFLYLFIVGTIALLPAITTFFVMAFTVTLDSPFDMNYLINQVPVVHIAKGELSITAAQPYYIRMKDSGEPLVIIDTTKPVSDWSKEFKNQSVVIVGKTQALMIDGKKGEKRLNDIPSDMNQDLDREDVRNWAEIALHYAWVIPAILALFMIPAMFIYRAIQALIYGACGLAIAKFLRVQMGYEDLVRLACVAVTPALTLDIVNSSLFHFHISVLWYFVLAMFYLGFGIKAAK